MTLAVTPVVAQSGLPSQLATSRVAVEVAAAPAGASEMCNGLAATIVGTEGADTLVGTNGDDVIVALGGNDNVIPGKGNDVTCAGAGDDSVSDGDGDDVIFGGDGDDQLIGGKGDDILIGEGGDDELNGGSGADIASGGDGDDTILGGRNDDYLVGGAGVNTLNGGQNTDTCILGEGGILIACELTAGLEAVADEYTIDEDTSLNVAAPGVLANDVDPSGTAAVTPLANVQSAAGGAVDVDADGSFTYDPMGVFDYLAWNESGTDSFGYDISDAALETSTAAVTIRVTGVNDAPTAGNVGVETSGSPVTITLVGFDPDASDTLTFAVVPGSFNGVGTLGTVDPVTGEIAYTPGDPDPEGNDPFATFDFTVTDPRGASATGTVGINEDDGPANPPGVVGVDAKPSMEETTTGTPLDIELLAAAPLAPEPGAIADLVFTIVSGPPSGEGIVSAPVSIFPDDHPTDPVRSAAVTYDPQGFGPTDPSDPPATTSFTFEACDLATGTVCDTAVIDVSVGAATPPAPPTISNVSGAVLENGNVMLDLSLGGRATGPQGNPDPADGRAGPQSFARPAGFAGPRIGGGFLAQTPDQTYSDEATFLATLGVATTYDFEQPAFPAASAVIGVVDDIDFQGRIGFAVNPPPPSGTQFMRGTGPNAPFDQPGIIDFTGLAAPIDSVGFFTGFGGIAAPAPFTRVQVYGVDLVLLHEEFIAHDAPAGSYFGYTTFVDEIVELRLQGFEADLTTPAAAQQFGIDDMTIGVGSITRDSTVAWNVADSNDDQLGDESNADGPGFPGAPALISATNNTTGGAGSNGVARVHIEWDISDLAGTIGQAEVTVHTSPGTSSLDMLDTMFYVASGDGDGMITNSDWETAATQVAGVVLPNQTGISEFTFDVTSQVQAAVDAGFDWFVVQGRVVEAPPSTNPGGERGMQIRSQCATCAGANPPELTISPPAALQPDLVVDSLTHDPANPTTEDNIAFTAVVKNIGNAAAGPSTLMFKIGGETPGAAGTLFPVPALAPGETFGVVRNASLTAQNYINTAEADFNEEVAESDENNNTATDSYTVTQAAEPPLVVGTFQITSLPQFGTLFTSTGAPITSAPFTLPDTMVSYEAGPLATVGQVDTFGFSATNASQLTSTALVNVAIVAELILPGTCEQVGRPPGCSPS